MWTPDVEGPLCSRHSRCLWLTIFSPSTSHVAPSGSRWGLRVLSVPPPPRRRLRRCRRVTTLYLGLPYPRGAGSGGICGALRPASPHASPSCSSSPVSPPPSLLRRLRSSVPWIAALAALASSLASAEPPGARPSASLRFSSCPGATASGSRRGVAGGKWRHGRRGSWFPAASALSLSFSPLRPLHRCTIGSASFTGVHTGKKIC